MDKSIVCGFFGHPV